jgi:quinohemoprotein ethanol dehydrogenase
MDPSTESSASGGWACRDTSRGAVLAWLVAAAGVLVPAWVAGEPAQPDGDWPTIGRTFDERFFSPLQQVDVRTVKRLGLAWYKDLGTSRGLESTPLVIGGVMYNTAPFNVTTAYDAATGRELWTYDPQVNRDFTRFTCCDVVTRGIAYASGKVLVATLDGRLIALDARTGRPVWTTNTFEGEPDWPYTITGAPRAFDGKVLIGNSGADLGVRGFVTAYDLESGRKLWRFHTVPGDPAKGFENPAMEMAAKTWTGEWWKLGGGGTAWDAIVYDRALGLVYIGVGNGSPWSQRHRSPGGGDNLFLASIVALKADTGEYVWHFQETPAEQFDYTAVQPMVLADLELGGRLRKVILHAPKNGYFYVIDRVTGEFISGQPLVDVNWSSGLDPKTGRPILTPLANYGETPTIIQPAYVGAHNWHPMAFSPLTGLVYLSVNQNAGVLSERKDFVPQKNVTNPGAVMGGDKALQAEAAGRAKAWLSAWDPVAQKERWRVARAPNASAGTLATAGNLVFQGTSDRGFAAYRADDGTKLWEMKVDNLPMAAPITYLANGRQYVALNAGYGGGLAHMELASGRQPAMAKGRLLVFALDGRATLPPMPREAPRKPPPRTGMSDQDLEAGRQLYTTYCQSCHGTLVRGGIKDLRYMDDATRRSFADIVLRGIRKDRGMAGFGDLLTPEQVSILYRYVTLRAYEDYGME